MDLFTALRQPRVLLLATAYFLAVTGSYGIEFFMPSILERWYALKFDALTWLVILPPLLALAGQLFVGWSSDRTRERWLHTAIPMGGAALGALLVMPSRGHLALTVLFFMLAYAGFKAYLPAVVQQAALALYELTRANAPAPTLPSLAT